MFNFVVRHEYSCRMFVLDTHKIPVYLLQRENIFATLF